MDIAPRYSGSVSAMGLTIANCFGFLTPLITGAITNDNARNDSVN